MFFHVVLPHNWVILLLHHMVVGQKNLFLEQEYHLPVIIKRYHCKASIFLLDIV